MMLRWVITCALLASIVMMTPVKAEGFSPIPEDHIGQVIASDGQAIPIRFWGNHKTPERIFLGVHGFSDYGRGFSHLLSSMDHPANSLLVAYDQRGFGESPSRNQWAGIERLNADLTEVVLHLASRYPDRPVHLLGESMGSALILASMHSPGSARLFAVSKADNRVHRAIVHSSILLAPAVWGWDAMPWYQGYGLRLLNRVFPDMQLSSSHARRIGVRPTDDPEVSAHLARDPLMLRDISVSMLAGLTDLMSEASQRMPLAGHRSLIVLGTKDEVIPAAAYCQWLKRNQVPSSTRWYVQSEGFHMLTRQIRRKEVISRLRSSYTHEDARSEGFDAATQALQCAKHQ